MQGGGTGPRWTPLGSVVGRGDPDRTAHLQAWHQLMVHGWKHQREIFPCSSCRPHKMLEGQSILSGRMGLSRFAQMLSGMRAITGGCWAGCKPGPAGRGEGARPRGFHPQTKICGYGMGLAPLVLKKAAPCPGGDPKEQTRAMHGGDGDAPLTPHTRATRLPHFSCLSFPEQKQAVQHNQLLR